MHSELLDVMKNFTEYELPRALSEYMDQVLHSVSRLECYVTGNVDQDGVSSQLLYICLLLYFILLFDFTASCCVVHCTCVTTLYGACRIMLEYYALTYTHKC